MQITDVQILINEKAEEKFKQKWNSRFDDEDLGEIEMSNLGHIYTDERNAFQDIMQTQEYKDFEDIMVKKYAKEISKKVIEKASSEYE